MSSEHLRPRLRGRQILIVEDIFFLADDLRRLFASQGAEVVEVVSDVERARHLVETGDRIDLAVLDIDLRGRDAFGVADLLGQRGIPFVFVTGYHNKHLPEQYRSAPLILKPYSESELLLAVEGLASEHDG